MNDKDQSDQINDTGEVVTDNLAFIMKVERESSSRTRWILIVLVTASCLALACFWNSLTFSWKHHRITRLNDYITSLDKFNKINKNNYYYQQKLKKITSKINIKDSSKHAKLLREKDSTFYQTLLDSLIYYNNKSNEKYVFNEEIDTSFLEGYYGKNALGMDNMRLLYMIMWYSESKDTKSFKIPFFDINFDINDLALIGGLGFSVILLLLFLSLIREKENIKIAFYNSNHKFKDNFKLRKEFYYLLSMNQYITMPHIMNKKGKRFLKYLPLSLICLPFIFSFSIFINDICTNQYGNSFSHNMTILAYFSSIISLIFIIILTVWSFIEIYEINSMWKKEKKEIDEADEKDKAIKREKEKENRRV